MVHSSALLELGATGGPRRRRESFRVENMACDTARGRYLPEAQMEVRVVRVRPAKRKNTGAGEAEEISAVL